MNILTSCSKSLVKFIIVYLFIISISSSLLGNDQSLKFQTNSQSKLWLEGDSTLHKFESFATSMNINFMIPLLDNPTVKLSPQEKIVKHIKMQQPVSLNIFIPVKKLISPTMGLDGPLYGAMMADKYPTITFELQNYQYSGESPTANGTILSIKASGLLNLAKEIKQITLNAKVTVLNSKILVEGDTSLLMTDFGISPPSILFFVNVENEAKVFYQLKLEKL